ncbi:MAG: UTP--glucose-1-phosphate uridylyltransferase [Dermatophilus congolensis]|nr:UTP--glucose-1-phosphate uridylyltransferase [Dermatophilus congolensis]
MSAITPSPEALTRATQKMRDAGVSPAAIGAFEYYFDQLASGHTGVVPEADITPLTDLPRLDDVAIDEQAAREAFAKTVIIKLNGGLGTSMGMTKAKTLLQVRDGLTFLDIIVEQVRAARAKYGVKLPLIFMNSFNTHDDTLEALAAHPDVAVDGLPLDFVQSQEPKLDSTTLEPVDWPADPNLEWCPPGHGDLYPSLLDTGILAQLIDAGYRYATVTNADNLGASPDARLAGWFASTGAPFAMEVCRRTDMDRKGGHLAIRKADERLILREVAQTPPDDMDDFADEDKHRFFNTNTLWLDLVALQERLADSGGAIGLPLIANRKTVDPKDGSSTKVIQIESAMGAAIEVFEGATAIQVPRSRFLPVKTTNELLLVRSDVYRRDEAGNLVRTAESTPSIRLDERYYKKIADFEARFPAGPPSLRDATSLVVEGDWTFEADVTVRGRTELFEDDEGASRTVTAGTNLP